MNYKNLPETVSFIDDELFLLDQTQLPLHIEIEKQKDIEQAFDSIRSLKVRGAPAIGVAGAYSLLIGLKTLLDFDIVKFKAKAFEFAAYLNSARPTAVNLGWGLKRMLTVIGKYSGENSSELYEKLKKEAVSIHEEDKAICLSIGLNGSKLLKEGSRVLTHCNAGALATTGIGTALAPIYIASDNGMAIKVYADETRPLLQGARLTAWELQKSGVDVTLICDGMAAYVMSKKLVDIVITGCDRVAQNGDAANKIGTLGVAIAAKYYNIPFYIACPSSTYDYNTFTGDDIIIEERKGDEVRSFQNARSALNDVKVLNPSFDVTPNSLISGFITEKGIIKDNYSKNLQILRREQR